MERRLAAAIRRLLLDWTKTAESSVGSVGVRLDEIGTAGKRKALKKRLDSEAVRLTNRKEFQAELRRAANSILISNANAAKKIGINLRTPGDELDRLVDAWRKEAVENIRSIASSESDRLVSILEAGEGERIETVAARIAERVDVTTSKAMQIARTQAARVNSKITEKRHQDAGIARYIWTTSGDERVSDAHAELDGQTFRYDDPPTDSDGNTGHPGDNRPNCRCTQYPVIPE